MDCCRFINRLYYCFLAGVEYITQDNNQAIKMPKILISKVLYARLSRIRPTTRVGENRAFVSAPKFSEIILDFIKKLMLIFGFCEVP